MPVSPAVTLSNRLHEAVQPARRRLESLPFFAALAGRTLSTRRYVDQLRAIAIVEATLDHTFATAREPAVRRAHDASMPRAGLVLADLAFFDRHGPLPDDPSPAHAALVLASDILQCAADRPTGLFGYLFVLQGMALGNLAHRAAARCAAGAGPGGTLWYDGCGEETGLLFRRFQEALDGLGLDEAAESSTLAAAVSAGESVERIHAALDPALLPERQLLATTFNVEAGVHAVPLDPVEAAAALRAGERCLAAFPYLLERWGERGHRFTGSDVAWLATLARLEPAAALRQVDWLGGVLARRGMPTLLLERQLLLLEEELAPAPGSRGSGVLGAAARSLATRRRNALPDAVAEPLVTEFLATAGHGPAAERLVAARLLLAAAADEGTGLPGTVAAVTAWYRDARFPASWTAAVDSLLSAASSALRTGAREG